MHAHTASTHHEEETVDVGLSAVASSVGELALINELHELIQAHARRIRSAGTRIGVKRLIDEVVVIPEHLRPLG